MWGLCDKGEIRGKKYDYIYTHNGGFRGSSLSQFYHADKTK